MDRLPRLPPLLRRRERVGEGRRVERREIRPQNQTPTSAREEER